MEVGDSSCSRRERQQFKASPSNNTVAIWSLGASTTPSFILFLFETGTTSALSAFLRERGVGQDRRALSRAPIMEPLFWTHHAWS